jgi:D-arabinose 1-dehydrogenase-like Zn-dependent alcohol dehydrogenase
MSSMSPTRRRKKTSQSSITYFILGSAAPLLCAGVTAYNALKHVAKEQPGGTVLNIIGVGGVGTCLFIQRVF